MNLMFGIKNWLIRILVILISFLCFTAPSISLLANSVTCELGHRSYSSIDVKIVEEIDSSTNQNLKYTLSAVGFVCKSRGDLIDYRNCTIVAEAIAAKGGTNLVEALNKVGGSRAASEFLGWGNKTTILKSSADFTTKQLTNAGYTKSVLTEIHSGLMEAAKKTLPSTGQLNPASVAKANQIQEILKLHFK